MVLGLVDLWCYRELLGNCPHASHQLTGNGHHDHLGMFASCDESWGAFTQPDLGLPTDVLDHFRLLLESQLAMATDLGGRAVRPGAFDQSPTGMGITGFGHRPLLAPLTRGICRRDQSQALHECS